MLLIFDLGRTHKKILIFDRDYKIVEEDTVKIPDVVDEDGDACEDIQSITRWMKQELERVLKNRDYKIEGINFSAHGASLVHLDKHGRPVTPLYDYMKNIPGAITEEFYKKFGGAQHFSVSTGSPVLDMLNSGIQLFWLKHARPELFARIETSLHFPQYGNFIFTGKKHADITSIGCHTGLWDFKENHYHSWLGEEGVQRLLPVAEPISTFDEIKSGGQKIAVGIGVHDSSAALYPFVKTASSPFVLLSTGTWNITLNPYFKGQLEDYKYTKDCLYFLQDLDKKVAASRIFLGKEHEFQCKKLASHFGKPEGFAHEIEPSRSLIRKMIKKYGENIMFFPEAMKGTGPIPNLKGPALSLSQFSSFEQAYHKLMIDLTYLQIVSLRLVAGDVKRLYVSGGFLKNTLFMELLQAFLPDWEIFEAENKRASALGAALALHEVWQTTPIKSSISPIKKYERKLDLNLGGFHLQGIGDSY